MPTLLTTHKMSPELRARVERSVRGGNARGPRPSRRALLRFGGACAVIAAVTWLFVLRSRAHAALESQRTALLERVREEGKGLDFTQRTLPVRLEHVLKRAARPYAGDEFSVDIKKPGAASRTLQEAMIYVRGPLGDFAGPSDLTDVAGESHRDAFVLCLVDPPPSRKEKALLGRAQSAMTARGAKHAPAVERLSDALHGLSFLSAAFEERVQSAETVRDIDHLFRKFDKAPIRPAVRAANARYFLFVMDEPKDGSGPTELDGACPHHVRVGLWDLRRNRNVFRVRRHVDPSWISEGARTHFARGINSCALAMDVRALLDGTTVADAH